MPNNVGLNDLHNVLMEQIQRLMEAETDEELETETKRAKAVGDVAKNVVDNTRNMIEATKMALEYGYKPKNTELLLIDGGSSK